MKTVGEILRRARQEAKLTLVDIAQTTRINLKYLEAIETNQFASLPPAAFTKGFIQNFAKAVNLNPKNVLAIFRRDYDQDQRGRIIPRGLTEPVKAPISFFNPTTTTLIFSSVLGLIILAFFIRQIIIFLSAPSLALSQPNNYIQTTSPVTVVGDTQPQATITINQRLINVDDDGHFQAQITLPPGEHTLIITATSRSQKSRSLERYLTVIEPPQ